MQPEISALEQRLREFISFSVIQSLRDTILEEYLKNPEYRRFKRGERRAMANEHYLNDLRELYKSELQAVRKSKMTWWYGEENGHYCCCTSEGGSYVCEVLE